MVIEIPDMDSKEPDQVSQSQELSGPGLSNGDLKRMQADSAAEYLKSLEERANNERVKEDGNSETIEALRKQIGAGEDILITGIREALHQGETSLEFNGFTFTVPGQLTEAGVVGILEQYQEYIDKYKGSEEQKTNELLRFGRNIAKLLREEQSLKESRESELLDGNTISAAQSFEELYTALEGKIINGHIRPKDNVYDKVFSADQELDSYLYHVRAGNEAYGQKYLEKARKIVNDLYRNGQRPPETPENEILQQKVIVLFEEQIKRKKQEAIDEQKTIQQEREEENLLNKQKNVVDRGQQIMQPKKRGGWFSGFFGK